jgi:hypothetical protein
MKKITIKKDKALIKLSVLLKRSPDELINEMLERAAKYGNVVDDPCDSGRLLIEVIQNGKDIYVAEGACLLCTGSYDPEVVKLFSQLILWGTGDCPDCGGECVDNSKYSFPEYELPPEIIEEKWVCTDCKKEI